MKEFNYADGFGYNPNLLEKYLFEFNPLVFSITPIVLFFVGFLLIRMTFFRKKVEHFFLSFGIIFFILAYYTASIASDVVVTVRYGIILYPLVAFLAAIGLWELYVLWLKKLHSSILIATTILAIFISSLSIFYIQPFYFNYTNFLLPKNKLISDAWGYGGYEAAQHLNSLPNPENITIWADYYGVCEFFRGKCLTDYKFDQTTYPIDYYVLTRRGKIRYQPDLAKRQKEGNVAAYKYYDRTNPVWELNINGRPKNYIKIFKAD